MKRIIGILAVLAVASFLGACTLDTEPTAADNNGTQATQAATNTPAPTNSPTPTSTPTPTPDERTEFYVGDTYSDDGLLITYVSSGDYISDNEFMQPGDGNKFIRMFIHADNEDDESHSLSSLSFKCYADGYECDTRYFDGEISGSISPGRSSEGYLFFEVPTAAAEIEAEYSPDLFSTKIIKFIFEGEKESGLTFEKNTTVSANALHKGDTAELKKVKITYLSAGEYKTDSIFSTLGEGMKYVSIEFEVENISEGEVSVSYLDFDGYADGLAVSGYYGREDDLSATLSAGRKAKGTITFEVPKDATTIEFEYKENMFLEADAIFVYEE